MVLVPSGLGAPAMYSGKPSPLRSPSMATALPRYDCWLTPSEVYLVRWVGTDCVESAVGALLQLPSLAINATLKDPDGASEATPKSQPEVCDVATWVPAQALALGRGETTEP